MEVVVWVIYGRIMICHDASAADRPKSSSSSESIPQSGGVNVASGFRAALGLKTTPWEKKREPQQVARHDRTRWMVDQTVEFLKTNRDRPCFVNLWFDDVHTPYVPSDEQLADLPEGPGTVQYRAVLRDTDQQVGRLLDALRDLEIAPNTLVLLAGDNGPQPSFERARTGGLRGMKWSLYEGGIRTPFIVRLPGVVPANVVNDTSVVCAVDFLPTLCRMAGIPAPDAAFDGEDLSAVFRGARTPRSKPLFWEYGRKPGEAGKVKGGFPYPNEPDSKSPNVAVRDGDWKLLVHADGTQAELYHLARDPNESKNLAATEKETAKRLQKAALEWRRTLPEIPLASTENAARIRAPFPPDHVRTRTFSD
jgi:arylsulfatase A-like enzyme